MTDCFEEIEYYDEYEYSKEIDATYNFCDEDETELITAVRYEYEETIYAEVVKQCPESGIDYFALVSQFMLIIDIDCGDNIVKPLKTLENYLQHNQGNFLIYKTKNGLRYLQTDAIYQGCNQAAIHVLTELQSDPKYIALCQKANNFRARIVPKNNSRGNYLQNIWLGIENDIAVCHYLENMGNKTILPCFQKVIELHDCFTQAHQNLPLA